MANVYKSIKLLTTSFYLQKYYHPSLSYPHEQCRKPKKVLKGPLFREDDCTLHVYLYLLVFIIVEGYRQKTRHCCYLGDRIDSMPCGACYFAQDDFNVWMNSSYSSYRPVEIHPFLHIVRVQFILFFKLSWWKISSLARNLINSPPPPPSSSDDLCLLFCLYPSCMAYMV